MVGLSFQYHEQMGSSLPTAITKHVKGLTSVAAGLAIMSLAGQFAEAQGPVPAAVQNPNIHVEYYPITEVQPQKAKILQDAKKWLEDRQVLERFAQLMTPLRLPKKLAVTASACNEANAYYDAKKESIILCYEFVPHIRFVAMKQEFTKPKDGDAVGLVKAAGITKDDIEVGGLAFTVLHEIGHAAFHLFSIPVMGRNEDAADQFAAYLALKFSPTLAQRLIKGGAGYLYSISSDPKTLADFADEHGSPTQRFSNVFCLAYGHDPKTYQYIADLQLLPRDRAATCADEYKQIEWAFNKTVAPHLDKDRAEALKAVAGSLSVGFR